MTLNEIWAMTYDEYVQYLLKKYGGAKCDYFSSPDCVSKGDVVRTDEGLECHHIDEDKYPLLSDRKNALEFPFECQRADRLVYADKVEHLILHIKIAEMGDKKKYLLGTTILIGTINELYENPPKSGYRLNMYNKIKDNFNLYLEILHRLAKQIYPDLHDYILRNEAYNMQSDYPKRMHDIPTGIEGKHWRLLRFIILRRDITRKKSKFPEKVAKAFSMHKRKEDYIFIDVDQKQISIEDLLN